MMINVRDVGTLYRWGMVGKSFVGEVIQALGEVQIFVVKWDAYIANITQRKLLVRLVKNVCMSTQTIHHLS